MIHNILDISLLVIMAHTLQDTYYVPSALHILIQSSQQPHKVSPIIIPILQRWKLRHREIKGLAQGLTTIKWGNQLSWTQTHTFNYYTILPPKLLLYNAYHFRGCTKQEMCCSYLCVILPSSLMLEKWVLLQCDFRSDSRAWYSKIYYLLRK